MKSYNSKIRHSLHDTLIVAAIAFGSAALPVYAMQPPDITPTETAMVPAYCKDTQLWPGGNPGGVERGMATYGEAFYSFHHYCWAMVWQMRAERPASSAMERRGNLTNALDDLDYVLRYVPRDHVFRPEILTRKGKVLRMQGKLTEATEVLRQAIELNSKYWRAFSELAVCYTFSNDREMAMSVLREGLTVNPDAKALRLHLQELEQQTGKRSSRSQATTQSRAQRDTTTSKGSANSP